MEFIEQRRGSLFDDVDGASFCSESSTVQRVHFVLKMYAQWMVNEESGGHFALNHGLSARWLLEDGLSGPYSMKRFLSDYRLVSGLRRDLVADEEGVSCCDAARCSVLRRNERNRSFYGRNEALRNRCYFIES